MPSVCFLGSFLALPRFYDGCGGPARAGLLFFIFLLPRKNSFLSISAARALLSAYLTYLDGYSLFVRRLSSKVTRPLYASKVSPFSSANFERERHDQVKYVSGFFLAEISEFQDGFICLW